MQESLAEVKCSSKSWVLHEVDIMLTQIWFKSSNHEVFEFENLIYNFRNKETFNRNMNSVKYGIENTFSLGAKMWKL